MKYLYRLWIVLLLLSAGVSAWFLGIALKESWDYWILDAVVEPLEIAWDIQEISSSRYVLCGSYKYVVDGKEYLGKSPLNTHFFLNRFVAESQKKVVGMSPDVVQVWYSQRNPKHSSLEREFPRKACFHAFLTLGVFLYFCVSKRIFGKQGLLAGI